MPRPSDVMASGWRFALASVVLVTYAQLAMKWGMSHWPATAIQVLPQALSSALMGPVLWVGSGLVAYALSMLCWLVALTRMPLNRAYPLLAISYVLVYLASAIVPAFDERLGLRGIIGVLLIAAGVAIINLRGRR